MIGLVFLCTAIPDEKWLDRISAIDSDGYEKHVVTDLESEKLPETITNTYPNIQFHQIHRVYVTVAGYWDGAFADRNNLKFMAERNPCAWEKTLFLHKRWNWSELYDHVWFIEYDVMVPCKTTLSNIDKMYPTADLLCASDIPRSKDPYWPWWSHSMYADSFHSMQSVFRGSTKLLNIIHAFAQDNRKLFHLEIMLNTIAHQHQLSIQTPKQLQKIVYRHDWTDADVQKDELVHPIKDMEQQQRIWNFFK